MDRSRKEISVTFEFNPWGTIRGISLNFENDKEWKVLKEGLSRLLKAKEFAWMKELFFGDGDGNLRKRKNRKT